MNWLTWKARLYAVAAAIIGLLGLLLHNRYLSAKAERAKHRADVAEAGLRRKAEDERREAEKRQEWSDYRREAEKDIDHVPDIISKPRDRR